MWGGGPQQGHPLPPSCRRTGSEDPVSSWPAMPSPPARRTHFHGRRREKNDSGTRGNFSNQLLVRQRKCFLMFRLIIDPHSACLIAASCRLTQGSRCGRRWSRGPPGVVVTPHYSPSPFPRGRGAQAHGEGTDMRGVSAQGVAGPREVSLRRTCGAGWPGTALGGHGPRPAQASDVGDSVWRGPGAAAGQPTRPETPGGAQGWHPGR